MKIEKLSTGMSEISNKNEISMVTKERTNEFVPLSLINSLAKRSPPNSQWN